MIDRDRPGVEPQRAAVAHDVEREIESGPEGEAFERAGLRRAVATAERNVESGAGSQFCRIDPAGDHCGDLPRFACADAGARQCIGDAAAQRRRRLDDRPFRRVGERYDP
ncbi:hypothetical protein ACVOMT_08120 [Sphingomonas panni]